MPVKPFVYQSRVRFGDTDASGRIFYVSLLNHFDAAEAERAAGRFGALQIRRGELALRSLFEMADGSDQEAHDHSSRRPV